LLCVKSRIFIKLCNLFLAKKGRVESTKFVYKMNEFYELTFFNRYIRLTLHFLFMLNFYALENALSAKQNEVIKNELFRK